MKTITMGEFAANVDLYVEMAQEQEILIIKNGKAVVKLVPYEE